MKGGNSNEVWRKNSKKVLSSMKNILEKWESFDDAVSSKDMYKLFKHIGYGIS